MIPWTDSHRFFSLLLCFDLVLHVVYWQIIITKYLIHSTDMVFVAGVASVLQFDSHCSALVRVGLV